MSNELKCEWKTFFITVGLMVVRCIIGAIKTIVFKQY